jgi:regulator of replication initiation timing
MLRPAIFSTDNPPHHITCVETLEYVNALRRRIEVQNDQMEALAAQVHKLQKENARLNNEIEKLSLDLGIKNEEVPPGWTEVKK